MEGEDGLDEARDPGRRAAEFAEEPPGFEGGDGLFNQCPDFRVGPVDGLLTRGKAVPAAAVRETDCAACALVALVGPAGEGAQVPRILDGCRWEPKRRSSLPSAMTTGSSCRTDRLEDRDGRHGCKEAVAPTRPRLEPEGSAEADRCCWPQPFEPVTERIAEVRRGWSRARKAAPGYGAISAAVRLLALEHTAESERADRRRSRRTQSPPHGPVSVAQSRSPAMKSPTAPSTMPKTMTLPANFGAAGANTSSSPPCTDVVASISSA